MSYEVVGCVYIPISHMYIHPKEECIHPKERGELVALSTFQQQRAADQQQLLQQADADRVALVEAMQIEAARASQREQQAAEDAEARAAELISSDKFFGGDDYCKYPGYEKGNIIDVLPWETKPAQN